MSELAPPPGETGRELGADALAVLEDALRAFTDSPRLSVRVLGVSARRLGKRVALTIRFQSRDVAEHEITLRCSMPAAMLLKTALTEVIE